VKDINGFLSTIVDQDAKKAPHLTGLKDSAIQARGTCLIRLKHGGGIQLGLCSKKSEEFTAVLY